VQLEIAGEIHTLRASWQNYLTKTPTRVSVEKPSSSDCVVKKGFHFIALVVALLSVSQVSVLAEDAPVKLVPVLKINKELDSFVYNISHNLRSPLASVIGLVNVARLDRGKKPEVIYQYFDMIEKSTLKLDETLKEILDFSQNLRTDLKISEINLKELCDESLNRLKYLKDFEKIEKQVDIISETTFHSDHNRLSLILTYIFSNSIKYRDVQKDSLFIKIIASISSTHSMLSILDNGVGIHPDRLPKVFDMFVRTNENSDGAGLGLYIVKEVIEKLNGTIEITSAYGEWTRADITLPNYEKPNC